LLRNYGIGFIFQTYNLLPVYDVYDNVEFALLLQKMSPNERKRQVMEALDWVGFDRQGAFQTGCPFGGECQRVAIARAMVKRPGGPCR
jgi:putative ABC transport system ATP-binding protein